MLERQQTFINYLYLIHEILFLNKGLYHVYLKLKYSHCPHKTGPGLILAIVIYRDWILLHQVYSVGLQYRQ